MELKRLCRRRYWSDMKVLALMHKKISLASAFLIRKSGYKKQQQQVLHPDWSNIDPDILEYIQKKFLPLADILRCRSVCRRWRCTTKAHLLCSLNPSSPPILMVPCKNNLFGDEAYFEGSGTNNQYLLLFLNLAATMRNQVDDSILLIEEGRERYPKGRFSHGWFIYLDKDLRFCMLNPCFFGTDRVLRFPRIAFPLQMPYRSWLATAHKVVFWGNPILGSSYGMVLKCGFRMKLYFAKCGDIKFNKLDHQVYPLDDARSIHDIICIKNRFVYGVTLHGYIEAWDCGINKNSPKKILSFQPKRQDIDIHRFSSVDLVESQGEGEGEGELFLVSKKYLSFPKDERKYFEVYRLNLALKTWEPVYSLGDRALILLGDNQTMWLSTKEFPQYERNSIYFEQFFRIQIFNLEDGSVKEAHSGTISVRWNNHSIFT